MKQVKNTNGFPLGLIRWERPKIDNFENIKVKKSFVFQTKVSQIRPFNKLISRVFDL